MSSQAIAARLSLDTSHFDKGISKAIGRARGFASGLQNVAFSAYSAVAGLVAMAGGIAGLAEGIKSAFDFGKALTDLSLRTGAPIKDLQIIGVAAQSAGMSLEDVGPIINKMQRSIVNAVEGNKQLSDAFYGIGLSAENLRSINPAKQFEMILTAIRKIADPAKRAQEAMAIFGRGGAAALQISAEDLDNAALFLGSSSEIMVKRAADFDRAADILHRVPDKFRQFFIGVGDKIIDAVLPALQLFDHFDLSPFGQRFGAALSAGITILTNAFKTGQLGDLLSLTLQLGIAKAWDYLLAGVSKLYDAIAMALKYAFTIDGVIFLGQFGNKLSAALVDAFQIPLAYLSAGLAKAGDALVNIIGGRLGLTLSKVLGIGGSKTGSFEQHFNDALTGLRAFSSWLRKIASENKPEKFPGLVSSVPEIQKKWDELVAKLSIPQPGKAGIPRSGTPEADAEALSSQTAFFSKSFDAIRRVGGGGAGVVGSDRIISIAEKQLAVQQRTLEVLKAGTQTTIKVF